MAEQIGSGRRFRRLDAQLAGKPGVKNPAALAAAIGRKKYGSDRMAELARQGRERAAHAPKQSQGRRVKL